MLPERPPSRSERLLRSTLERSPAPQQQPQTSPRAHRRRHSHVPGPTSTMVTGSSTSTSVEDDDQLSRAAFLYRTVATSSSPIHPHHHNHYHHHHPSPSPSRPASPSFRPESPSPSSSRRQSLQRSPASDGLLSFQTLQRHNSIPASKRPTCVAVEPLPLTPHEQVLRARLERVLLSGRVVDSTERSRERRRSRDPQREKSPGWVLGSTSPKSTTSSSDYPPHSQPQLQTHHRSRSKTDPTVPPSTHPTPATPRRAATSAPSHSIKSPYLPSRHSQQRHPVQSPHPPPRNNSNSSSTVTPPLTADASPVLGLDNGLMIQQQQQQQQHDDPDDMRLLTPPPTPPLVGTTTPAGSVKRPGIAMYRSRTGDSTEFGPTSSPHMYPYKRRELEGSVENLDLTLGVGPPPNTPYGTSTFNARKASERCRMMEGYVSFASVEGLGTPPDGVDDNDKDEDKDSEDKRGRGLSAWARRLFVGIGHGQQLTTIS